MGMVPVVVTIRALRRCRWKGRSSRRGACSGRRLGPPSRTRWGTSGGPAPGRSSCRPLGLGAGLLTSSAPASSVNGAGRDEDARHPRTAHQHRHPQLHVEVVHQADEQLEHGVDGGGLGHVGAYPAAAGPRRTRPGPAGRRPEYPGRPGGKVRVTYESCKECVPCLLCPGLAGGLSLWCRWPPLMLAACGDSDDDEGGGRRAQQTYKLAFVGPLTGPNANLGINIRNGAEVAIEEANTAGGDIKFELERVRHPGRAATRRRPLQGPVHQRLGHPRHRRPHVLGRDPGRAAVAAGGGPGDGERLGHQRRPADDAPQPDRVPPARPRRRRPGQGRHRLRDQEADGHPGGLHPRQRRVRQGAGRRHPGAAGEGGRHHRPQRGHRPQVAGLLGRGELGAGHVPAARHDLLRRLLLGGRAGSRSSSPTARSPPAS